MCALRNLCRLRLEPLASVALEHTVFVSLRFFFAHRPRRVSLHVRLLRSLHVWRLATRFVVAFVVARSRRCARCDFRCALQSLQNFLARCEPGRFIVRKASMPKCLALSHKLPTGEIGHALIQSGATGWTITGQQLQCKKGQFCRILFSHVLTCIDTVNRLSSARKIIIALVLL